MLAGRFPRRTRCTALLTILALLIIQTQAVMAQATIETLEYPKTKKLDLVETLHGVDVPDPYRWLEDLDSEQTAAWVEAQNVVTFSYLEKVEGRDAIKERLSQLWDFERISAPMKKGDLYFFSKNDGLQNQSVIYVTDTLDGEARVLIDPNNFSEDGTVALSGFFVNEPGSLVAYATSSGGSDWKTIHVRDVATGEDLPDTIEWVKFSGASWTKDGKGFFYSRYDEPVGDQLSEANYYQKLYYHELGKPQSDDVLVYERPDQKEWGFQGQVTDDGRYLIISVWQGTDPKNRVFYKDLEAERGEVVELLDDFDAEYTFIDNDGSTFWFFTDLEAPKGRVIAIDSKEPARANWNEIIPQAENTLAGISVVGDRFVATYLEDAKSVVKTYGFDGSGEATIALPGIGSASGFDGSRKTPETFYSFQSFHRPLSVYRLDVATGKSTLHSEPKLKFSPDDYQVDQVFYKSEDGTRIPMFICQKKGVKRDGPAPTYLYGYGGFNISLTPRFGVANLVWMELGGIFVQANIRGGGEYGKAWHDAGKLANKQNVFDDFIAAAQWLIDQGITSSEKLAIGGGSNGGLLVGACITQRPDLFGAALPAVGVLDMLRFHKFTIGWAWTSDYGSPDDPAMFEVLKAYSPYHNLKPGTEYPATLITTGDHDDRVVPCHSFKFAAALQAAHMGENPVLIRIETRAGHGAGKPTSKVIEEHADRWAFLVGALDMELNLGDS